MQPHFKAFAFEVCETLLLQKVRMCGGGDLKHHLDAFVGSEQHLLDQCLKEGQLGNTQFRELLPSTRPTVCATPRTERSSVRTVRGATMNATIVCRLLLLYG
jgi:hypothetical protein